MLAGATPLLQHDRHIGAAVRTRSYMPAVDEALQLAQHEVLSVVVVGRDEPAAAGGQLGHPPLDLVVPPEDSAALRHPL